jgi:hypothetical protein
VGGKDGQRERVREEREKGVKKWGGDMEEKKRGRGGKKKDVVFVC